MDVIKPVILAVFAVVSVYLIARRHYVAELFYRRQIEFCESLYARVWFGIFFYSIGATITFLGLARMGIIPIESGQRNIILGMAFLVLGMCVMLAAKRMIVFAIDMYRRQADYLHKSYPLANLVVGVLLLSIVAALGYGWLRDIVIR
jgi:hypothetical protein